VTCAIEWRLQSTLVINSTGQKLGSRPSAYGTSTYSQPTANNLDITCACLLNREAVKLSGIPLYFRDKTDGMSADELKQYATERKEWWNKISHVDTREHPNAVQIKRVVVAVQGWLTASPTKLATIARAGSCASCGRRPAAKARTLRRQRS
jgi:hypothetical protein